MINLESYGEDPCGFGRQTHSHQGELAYLMAFDDCMGCRSEVTGYMHLDGIVDELYYCNSCLSGLPVSRVSEFELPLYANAQRSR